MVHKRRKVLKKEISFTPVVPGKMAGYCHDFRGGEVFLLDLSEKGKIIAKRERGLKKPPEPFPSFPLIKL